LTKFKYYYWFIVNILGHFYKFKIWKQGSICNFKNFKGPNLQFLNFFGSICNSKNIIGVNLNFLKHMRGGNLKVFAFWCHLKFLKFNLSKIFHKFLSFLKKFKLIIQTKEFRQNNLNSLKILLYLKTFLNPYTL
jgi:hypothetical protein